MIMRNILKFLFLCYMIISCVCVYPNTYTLRGLSVSDGLSDLLVNALYKDSIGFVWIGTGNSLDRFDGTHIRRYPISGNNERLKRVNAIAEMPGNQLWMGNGMGLWRMNRERTAFERVIPENIDFAIYTLLHDGKGTLYIGSERGLLIYKDGNLEQIMPDKNTLSAANSVKGLAFDRQGILWMATQKGLYSLQLSDRQIQAWHDTPNGDSAFNNLTCIGSTLYLGTMDQGILAFDIQTKRFSPFISVGCNVISSLSSDGKDLLYVGTDGNGAHFISVSQKAIIRSMYHEANNNESLRSNSIYSLLVDRDGVIWVGFYQLGLDYTLYQNSLFSTYSFPPFFNSVGMPVRALAINGNEKLVGSRDGLFYIDEARKRFKSFKTPEMRSSMVFCILRHQEEYYVGTYGGGMYIFDPQTLQIRDFDKQQSTFLRGSIFCIEHGPDGQLWIGTSHGIYCYHNGKQTAHYNCTNSKLPDGNVYEIYFDSTHRGWICTENGVCIWDPSSGKIRTDVFPEGFIHKEKIRVVYEDSRHELYFCPDKGPLFISNLAMNRFRRLQPGTPLEGRDGMFIIEDESEHLWIGTGDGLFCYDKADHFVPYNFIDGIPSSTFTLCPPVSDAQGNIWFGNSKGLLLMNATRLDDNRIPDYPVRITGVYINGKKSAHAFVLDPGTEHARIELEPNQRNITFCFSDFSYTSPFFVAYEYVLEGEDEEWTPLQGSSEVSYYDLAAGKYVFKVRRMGQPDTETQLTVKVASSQNVWGIMGTGIVILLLAAAIRHYLTHRRKMTETPEHNIVEEQTADATEATATPEAKYKNTKVSTDDCILIVGKLETVMKQDKPYRNPDLKIADLAQLIGTSAHTLSYVFNQHLKCSYYDYVNNYRITEFKHLVESDEYSKYTLSALATLCGFSSRASFFRSFKKATGITPNEYARSIGKAAE